ncbi:MAG: MoaD/ThiS family protein [Candidatus Omnitrophica bacterium]|nr:MoaD/ThiS family protein [Candidatus Omnitrophota bacterium]
MEKAIHIQYFALLREQRGESEETLRTTAQTPQGLYAQLKKDHRFTLPEQSVRVSINEQFADWQTALRSGDRVVFLPPVSGG